MALVTLDAVDFLTMVRLSFLRMYGAGFTINM